MWKVSQTYEPTQPVTGMALPSPYMCRTQNTGPILMYVNIMQIVNWKHRWQLFLTLPKLEGSSSFVSVESTAVYMYLYSEMADFKNRVTISSSNWNFKTWPQKHTKCLKMYLMKKLSTAFGHSTDLLCDKISVIDNLLALNTSRPSITAKCEYKCSCSW